MSRRRWTHRRLGIGADRPSELAIAGEDRLLDEVGARGLRGLGGSSPGEPLRALLGDYVTVIDAQIDRVDPRAYRLGLPSGGDGRSRAMAAVWRRSRRTLIPVAAGATVLAIVAGAAALPHATRHTISTPKPVVQPHVAAGTESRSLLRHASTLLTAAHIATSPSDRHADVLEARADLQHVATLLPLAPRAQQPGLRHQFEVLHRASVRPGPGHAYAVPGPGGGAAIPWPGAGTGRPAGGAGLRRAWLPGHERLRWPGRAIAMRDHLAVATAVRHR